MTGMDALTHCVEAYTCLAADPLSDAWQVLASKKLVKTCLKVLDNPSDAQGRLELAQSINHGRNRILQFNGWFSTLTWPCSGCSGSPATWFMHEPIPAICA